jgi:selenocysteine-specific elongation factor
LQNHQESVETVQPGSRTAVNLSGVDKQHIKRGDIVAALGTVQSTRIVDVSFRHLPTASRSLKHNAEVRFFSHAAESMGYARLVDDQELKPGAEGWLQIQLKEPLALSKGDRFILRYPSPPETIGGGVILDPHPAHRWRRFKPEVIERFKTLALGTPEQLLLHLLDDHVALNLETLSDLAQVPRHETKSTVEDLITHEEIVVLSDGSLASQAGWNRLANRIIQELESYHRKHPLQPGMPREAFRSRLGLPARLFGAVVEHAEETGLLVDEGAVIRTPSHTVRFTPVQQKSIDELMALIATEPTRSPSVKEAAALLGEDVLYALFVQGKLIQVSPDVFFDAATYQDMVWQVERAIETRGSITVAQVRDLFGTSRKYVLALLEHLDAIGVTRREDDRRVLAHDRSEDDPPQGNS